MVGLPLTATVKEVDAVAPSPSVTVSVMVAFPYCPAAGVTVTVRLAPLPPRAMLLTGTRLVLEEAAATVRLAAAVSTSPTVKANAAVALP